MSESPPSLATEECFKPAPGPWTVDSVLTHYGMIHTVRDAKGEDVCDQLDEPDATARLIAAAPEMLEALRAAEEGLRSCYQVCDYPANGRSRQDDALRDVRDAIAKATGQS